MRKYEFVYMADSKFIIPTAVSACSLIENKSSKCVYLIHMILDSVNANEIAFLEQLKRENVEIHIHEVDAEKYDELSRQILTPDIYVSRTDMLKFELPNYLPDTKTLLYIDGDTIIQDCIEQIFEDDLTGMYLAAVDDMGDIIDENGVSKSASRIGYPGIHYFNAGIMLLNLSQMRHDNVSQKLWDYRKRGINYFMSQDALNIVTLNKRKILPYRYNFITSIIDTSTFYEINMKYFDGKYSCIDELLSEQTVLHMAGKMKPWVYNMPWITDKFMKYYALSPYAQKRLNLLSPILCKNGEMREQAEMMLWNLFIKNT